MNALRAHVLRIGMISLLTLAVIALVGCVEKKVEVPRQTLCPVTGNRCSREYSIVIEGYRIFGCSPACIPSIKSRPQKWIDKIRANGEEPESLADIKSDRKGLEANGY